MYRLIMCLAVVLLLGACEKDNKDDVPTGQATQATPADGTPRIPGDEFSAFEEAAHAMIRPFFDEDGTITERTVKPGEYFDLFVIGEFEEMYPMHVAEYKLELPSGISVMGTTLIDSSVVTVGKFDNDLMIAFKCSTGPKLKLASYICKVGEEFEGGTVETMKGVDQNFIGFAMCDQESTVRARGGVAQLLREK